MGFKRSNRNPYLSNTLCSPSLDEGSSKMDELFPVQVKAICLLSNYAIFMVLGGFYKIGKGIM